MTRAERAATSRPVPGFPGAPKRQDGEGRPSAEKGERAVRAPASLALPGAIAPGVRVMIQNVDPAIDGGAYPAKAVVGDRFAVACDILSDGHERLAAVLLHRMAGDGAWSETPLSDLGNDRWAGEIALDRRGLVEYSISAWHDLYGSWCDDAEKRAAAGQPLDVELQIARALVADSLVAASGSAGAAKFEALLAAFDALDGTSGATGARLALLTSADARGLFLRHGPRAHLATLAPPLTVRVERRAARFSAWYELMPRSQSGNVTRHGTLRDVIARLPYVKELGFDVLYLPPIHPIGTTNRKGRNNSLTAAPGDPGSPYAIGSAEGGHDAIHPELGTLDDFADLVAAAREAGLEIALDFAIQCSPDHPWIKDHPEWFDWRPDGTIRFAENPPKKYEDIVNVQFYGDAFPALWHALRDVVQTWVDRGVKIFRVDNPHTKPFPFWQWLIADIQSRDPDVIFLAEAFTRPKIMAELAKIGFTQSYSYFTWRNTKWELAEYLGELTRGPARHFMRPNFFPNTPDINPYYLQKGGRAGFRVRLALAASLGTNYGIYSGFELCEAAAIPGKEEYANSEKYELRAWDWDRPGNIRDDVAKLNALRRSSPALQTFANVTFYNAWNDHILYYGKATPDRRDFLLFAINLDPHNAQGAHFEVPLWEFGLGDDASIWVENALTSQQFVWTGKVQHMHLDPHVNPYMVWRLVKPRGAPA